MDGPVRGRRDEFTKTIKDILAFRTGDRCSNPNCQIQTHWAHSEPALALTLGVAAHISAAAAGGPRYNDELSIDDRRSISNAIWLCNRCAVMVDRDPVLYPADLLRQWKRLAERRPSDPILHDDVRSVLLLQVYEKIIGTVNSGRRAQIDLSGFAREQESHSHSVKLICRLSIGDFTYWFEPSATASQLAKALARTFYPSASPEGRWALGDEKLRPFKKGEQLRDVERKARGVVCLLRFLPLRASASFTGFSGLADAMSAMRRDEVRRWLLRGTRRIARVGESELFGGWLRRFVAHCWSTRINNVAWALTEAKIELEFARTLVTLLESSEPPLPVDQQDTVAWLYYRLGQYEKARSLLVSVVADSPGVNETALYHLYFASRACEDVEMAKAIRLFFLGRPHSVEAWRVGRGDDEGIPDDLDAYKNLSFSRESPF